MSNDIQWNEKESRYERDVDGQVAYVRTHMKDDVLYVDYVFTPSSLRGQGVGSAFMRDLMELARSEAWKVKPICGYAAGWLQRHSEFHDLLVAD